MFITKFILWIFNTIVEQRNRLLQAAWERDPKNKALLAEVEEGRKKLADWAEKQIERDPEAKKDFEVLRKMGSR